MWITPPMSPARDDEKSSDSRRSFLCKPTALERRMRARSLAQRLDGAVILAAELTFTVPPITVRC